MVKVGIVGGTGYTGVELLRLLAQHPDVDLAAITSRKEAGMAVSDMFPNLRGQRESEISGSGRMRRCNPVRRGIFCHAQRRRHAAGQRLWLMPG